MAADPVIETPVASGSNQPTPSGVPASTNIPPAPATQPAPAEQPNASTAVAQDIANKYPNQAPAALTSGTPQIPVTVAQPAAAQPQPAQPQTPHEMHQSLYQRALSILAPPTKYVDAQGNPQQTRPSLSNSILSGAIAGLLTPTAYRQGTFGPEVDTQQTAANAFAAGKQQRQEADKNVQAKVDDLRVRKLQALSDNANTFHLHMGVMQDAANMRDFIQKQNDNDAPLVKMAVDNDKNLDPNDPNAKKAVWGRGYTMDELLKHPEWGQALTQHTIAHDGTIDVPDANGNMVPTPTYTIIDPNVKANMTKEAADIASQIYPSWKTAFDASGGSMRAKLGQLSAINNQVSSVQFAEKVFQDAADSDDKDLQALGIKKDVKNVLMKAVRQGTQGAQQALNTIVTMENAKTAGGTTADVLSRLINDPETAPGRQYVLDALGITADKAQAYIDAIANKRTAAATLAHEGGMGENAPMAIPQINALVSSYETNPELKPEDKDLIKAMIPAPGKDGQIHMQQKQGEKVANSIREITNSRISESQAAADPDAIASLVNLTVGAGDLTNGKDLFTGNRAVKGRIAYDIASAKMASDIGLNPIHYTAAAQKAKQEKFDEYSSTNPGKVGSQLNSFNTFLTHNADAVEASNEWKRTNSEFWNTPLNKLEQKFGNDPSYIKFKASLLAPDKEFMNFLNAGHAETVEDAKAAADITNVNSSPARIFAAMQQLAKTADDRAAALGDSYVGVVGTTFPNLINANSRQVLKTLGVPSRATAFNGDLPRNPAFVAHPNLSTLQPMPNLDMAKRFVAAAGNDREHAVAMAREHGWILQ